MITDGMCLAAAHALADMAVEHGLDTDFILPTMAEWDIFPREAAAVAAKVVEQGIARVTTTFDEEYHPAGDIIRRSHDMTRVMMVQGLIAEAE